MNVEWVGDANPHSGTTVSPKLIQVRPQPNGPNWLLIIVLLVGGYLYFSRNQGPAPQPSSLMTIVRSQHRIPDQLPTFAMRLWFLCLKAPRRRLSKRK
jgi:hypothetical protein